MVIIIEDTVYRVSRKQFLAIMKIKEQEDESGLSKFLENHISEYKLVGPVLFSFRG